MPRVRIVRNWTWPDLLQQTPGGTGVWDGIRFGEEKTRDCDFCIVLNNLGQGEALAVPPAKVLRVVQEPPTEFFKPWHENPVYSSLTLTCDPERNGAEYIHSHPLVPWHINRSYDFLTTAPVPEKNAAISWITSTKTVLEGHRQRMDFLNAVAAAIPELQLLGTRVHHIVNAEARQKNEQEQRRLGFGLAEDKWAGLAPYKYSLAVENFSGPDYWTEKVADCFLAWTMPIYHGCPNLADYFPPESFIAIDIGNPQEAIETIRRALRDDPWEKRLGAIGEARRRVLEKHQFFPTLARHIQSTRFAGRHEKAGQDLPRISVVVCTYNREKLLPACLESLADQSLPAGALEVLVVDNNSSDGTKEVISGFTSRHPHFRGLFESQQGLSHARNRGLREARAEYIGYIDDDSSADRSWLAEAFRIIAEKGPDIFGGTVRPLFGEDKPEWLREEYATRGDMGETGWIDNGFILGTNIFFRKSLLQEYGGFDPRLGMKGDQLGYHEETQLVSRAFREKKAVYFSRALIVVEREPEYKQSLAYYIYAKYRAGVDGLDLWHPPYGRESVWDLPALIDQTMAEFQTALMQRDPGKHPHPENYLFESRALNRFLEIGMLTRHLLNEKKPSGEKT